MTAYRKASQERTLYRKDSQDRRTISSGILTEKQDSQKGHPGQSIRRTVRTRGNEAGQPKRYIQDSL
jgi:hypothetical protein